MQVGITTQTTSTRNALIFTPSQHQRKSRRQVCWIEAEGDILGAS